MTYSAFLHRVVRTGIEAAKRDYARDEAKREGAIAGFSECEGKTPSELKALLERSRMATRSYSRRQDDAQGYWRIRCYEAEVEWVCNVVSAMLMNEGKETIITPTARGVLHAAKILEEGMARA
jgi:hypothetical protein